MGADQNQGLTRKNFDISVPTFFSMLGVSQYLDPQALHHTLEFVHGCLERSEIVFSIVPSDALMPDVEANMAASYATRFAAAGEPWIFRPTPEEMLARLSEIGYANAAYLSPAQANARYFADRDDGLSASSLELMIQAMV